MSTKYEFFFFFGEWRKGRRVGNHNEQLIIILFTLGEEGKGRRFPKYNMQELRTLKSRAEIFLTSSFALHYANITL